MSAQEHGRCIDCGRHAILRLPRRFPHICADCLFPPLDPDDDSHQEEMPENTRTPTLVEALHTRVANWARLDIPFGKKGGTPRGPGERYE